MTPDHEHRALVYKIARAYYEDCLTQQQIGERFGISRVKVSRLLRRARDEKTVQITIAPPAGTNAETERSLEGRYGLKEAIVITPSDRDPATIVAELGPAAAACLARCLQGAEVVAVSWGTAVLSVVNAIAPASFPDVRVVQLIGGLGEVEAQVHGAELARRLAQALGGRPRLMQAPGLVKDKAVRDALVLDPQVADTLGLAAAADVALVGLGAFTPGATLLSTPHALSRREIAELKRRGVAGDIALQFFDARGRALRTSVGDRVVGLDLAAIKKIRRVIGVAGGEMKLGVIRAALRGGLLDVLVTDDDVAAALLETAGESVSQDSASPRSARGDGDTEDDA